MNDHRTITPFNSGAWREFLRHKLAHEGVLHLRLDRFGRCATWRGKARAFLLSRLHALLYAITQMGLVRHRPKDECVERGLFRCDAKTTASAPRAHSGRCVC